MGIVARCFGLDFFLADFFFGLFFLELEIKVRFCIPIFGGVYKDR